MDSLEQNVGASPGSTSDKREDVHHETSGGNRRESAGGNPSLGGGGYNGQNGYGGYPDYDDTIILGGNIYHKDYLPSLPRNFCTVQNGLLHDASILKIPPGGEMVNSIIILLLYFMSVVFYIKARRYYRSLSDPWNRNDALLSFFNSIWPIVFSMVVIIGWEIHAVQSFSSLQIYDKPLVLNYEFPGQFSLGFLLASVVPFGMSIYYSLIILSYRSTSEPSSGNSRLTVWTTIWGLVVQILGVTASIVKIIEFLKGK